MKYQLIAPDYQDQISSLFRSVFSDSEGEAEGQLIGDLALALGAKINNQDIICYGAVEADEIVGSLFFTQLKFNQVNEAIKVYLLAPMAVQTKRQGQGIGQTLIKYALDDLKRRSVSVAITYGDPSFYGKVGFQSLSEDVIKAPLTMSLPEGWLGQSLTAAPIPTLDEIPTCVAAFNNPAYW